MNDKIEAPECSAEELKAITEQDEIDCQYWHEVETRFDRRGFVAFLDLLGYKQIAASDDERRIREVVCTIKGAKEEATAKICNAKNNGCDPWMLSFSESFFDDIHISYISDAIVVHHDLPEIGEFPEPINEKEYLGGAAIWFVTLVRQIYSDLLRKELPSRCAIAFGKFFWDAEKKSILAGSALVEAHQKSETLPFSGIILCDSVTKDFAGPLSLAGEWCAINNLLVPDLKIEPYRAKPFTAALVRPDLLREEVGDIEEFVNRQYRSFNKRIVNDAIKYKLDKSIELFKMLYST